jgi:hypothetical protein
VRPVRPQRPLCPSCKCQLPLHLSRKAIYCSGPCRQAGYRKRLDAEKLKTKPLLVLYFETPEQRQTILAAFRSETIS